MLWRALALILSVVAVAGRPVKHGKKKSNRDFATPVFGGYFPDWAQYRPAPYTFLPSDLSGIVSKLNIIWYGFGYFCPDSSMVQPYWVTQLGDCQGKQPFQLTNPEPKDPTFYEEIAQYKSSNADLKFILSIGGWNFPSNFFSGMVASSANRNTFIQSCLQWMKEYNFDGIDLDWEYPCSAPRQDEVKISCTQFDEVTDEGGNCPDDNENFVMLVKEMREAFGDDYMITVATQADMGKATAAFNFTAVSEYIDLWDLMSYDYTVSDISDSSLTAPNEPLYPPSQTPSLSQDSVSTTIDGYIAAGVDPAMITVGLAMYGHTWYTPGVTGNDWQAMGVSAQIQGDCCGPFQQTYGGKYGPGSQECGTLMYSEIVNMGLTGMAYFDNTTQSDITYQSSTNLWIGYQDVDTMTAITKYAQNKGLAGAFLFDLSMDSNWKLANVVYNLLN